MLEQESVVRQRVRDSQRIVIKIGTSIISNPEGPGVNNVFLQGLADEISALRRAQRSLLLVTSGAIGMGAGLLGIEERIRDTAMQQSCAAIGQPLLMQSYRQAFADTIVAQLLVTRDLFNNPDRFDHLRTCVEKLLDIGVVPIINENDSVSTEEIGPSFGDNDQLSAIFASKIAADLLIILSDVDGFYDSNPHWNQPAQKISYLESVEEKHLVAAGDRGSTFSTGGMRSKLEAVRIAGKAGCIAVIASGLEEKVVSKICNGEEIGTVISPRGKAG